MIIVTGKTYDHREKLIQLGGKFDKENKQWIFLRLGGPTIELLRKTVGLIVNVIEETQVEPFDNRGASTIYGDDPTYFNYFARQNPRAFFGFSSLGKFIEYIERLPRHHALDPKRSGWKITSELSSWAGSRDMAEAIRIARQGWQEGGRMARQVIEAFALANPRVRQRRASVAGGTVNVGRMLSGDPAHMVRRPKSPGSKIATLFVEAGCNGDIHQDTLVIRAAIIGAIVDLMENAGYSCTIVVTDVSVAALRTYYQLAVVIKESGERMNIDDLVFALGHPSFLRRFSFAACSSVEECRPIWETQGAADNAFTDDHPCGSNEFYVPVIPSNPKTVNEALEWIIPENLPITVQKTS